MSINVADKIQVIKDNVHIIKIQNENDETLWEYVEPTITVNDVLYAFEWATSAREAKPEIYHLTDDSTNKIFFYKYSNFDNTEANAVGYINFGGSHAWTDGTDTYISNYKYNKDTNTWTYIKWMVPPYGGVHETERLRVDGEYIWTDGTDIFYLAPDTITGVHNINAFKFDKLNNKWTRYDAITPPSGTHYGNRIWTDGNTVYYSNGSDEQYFWNKKDQTWVKQVWSYADKLGVYYNFDFNGDELFELNGTIYAMWTRDRDTIVFFLNSDGYWEPSQIPFNSPLSDMLFYKVNSKFTDGTNTYLSNHDGSNYDFYKIIEIEQGNLTYEKINVKSIPRSKGPFSRLAFSLGMNAKKGDAKARPYSSTIF